MSIFSPFPSLPCPGYKWHGEAGVVGLVAAPGFRPSPGLWSSKNTQENHNFLPLLTFLPLVCHGATLLTAYPLHCSHCQLCDPPPRRCCAVCSHLCTSEKPFPRYYIFIWLEFTLSSQSHLGAKIVTSTVYYLSGLNWRDGLRKSLLSAGNCTTSEAEALIYRSVISFCLPLFHLSVCSL